ncbi:mycofactocin-coupled SDR family oxidoreductase [Cryptosporangium sp. NPDC048952]|uniref:mycofactocin-coupled SDR family oxidoreductase n=1 Tax=Cryptosporangium sp. NPDC048952 TaxID=3363961 RepID=UPI0037195B2B
MGKLEGKVAFITGAARGQGRSHAIRLAQEGADIVAIDIAAQMPEVGYPMATPDDLAETVKEVEALDRRIVASVADVRDIDSMRAVFDSGIAEFGRVDIVSANAGVMPVYGETAQTMDAWNATLDVLLTGVLNTIELTYPRMIEQGDGGSIVVTSSMAALQPMIRTLNGKTLGLLGYSAAKAAVINLANNYASVLAEHKIRVNVICPTGVHTPMTQNAMIEEYFVTGDPRDHQSLQNAIPVDMVDPVDISNTLAYLASDDARYVTGVTIPVAAGATLR